MQTREIVNALYGALEGMTDAGIATTCSLRGAWMGEPLEMRATVRKQDGRRHTLVLSAMEITHDLLAGEMPNTAPIAGYLNEEDRVALARALPSDAPMAKFDKDVASMREYTLTKWAAYLGHPCVEGTNVCSVCPEEGECALAAFTSSLTATVIRQLNLMGALRPIAPKPNYVPVQA